MRPILQDRPEDLSVARDRGLPPSIWALGFVSMLMDISSEMIHSLLPVYLVTALGISMAMVGLVEGVSEATASIVKVFSGAVSDWLGKRKALLTRWRAIAAEELHGGVRATQSMRTIPKSVRHEERDG